MRAPAGKKNTRTLQEPAASKDNIIAAYPDPVISTNLKGAIIDWNPEAERTFEWTKQEATGEILSQLIIAESFQKQFQSEVKHTQKAEKLLKRLVELNAISKSGVEFPIELTISIIIENKQKLIYYFIKDISQRKQREQELRQSEFYLKRAQSIASIGSWEMSGKFIETYWSDEFYRIHGLKPQSVHPSTRLRLSMVHVKDRSKLQTAIDAAVREGKPYAIENRIIRPDGEVRWVLSQGEATADIITGKPKVFGTILDITQRKLHEQQISDLNRSFSEFHSAITSASIISRANRQGSITYVNEKFVNISGYTKSELIGQDHRIINSNHHPQTFWNDMWKTIASGKTWRGEVKNKAKNGSYYWVDTFIMPFIDEAGKVREFLSIRNDITHRKIGEELLSYINSKLSETLIFGKMGSAELNLANLELTVSKEMYRLLDVEGTQSQVIHIEQFLKKYVSPQYLPIIGEKIKEGASGGLKERKDVSAEFEMITAKGRRIWIEAKGIFHNNRALGILQDITQKKATEESLVARTNMINRMLNGITDGFFAVDPQFNFTLVNPAFTKLSGMQPEEMIGKNMVELFPFMKESKLLHAYQIAFQTQTSSTLEQQSMLKSGQIFQINIYPNAEGLFIYFKDITIAKKSEEALAASEERFRSLYNNTPAMMHSIDAEGYLINVSDYWLQKMEYTREEVLGRKSTDFQTEYSKQTAIERSLPEFFTTGQVINKAVQFVTKKGKTLDTLLSATSERDTHGKIKNSLAVITDITEKKQLEKSIQENEERFRTIAQNIPKGAIFQFLLTVDEHYSFPLITDGISSILGIEPEQIIADGNVLITAIHPDDAILFWKSIKQSAKSLSEFHNTARFCDTNGNYWWLTLHAKPKRLSDNTTLWDGVLLDETEQKKAEEVTIKANEIFSIVTKATNDVIWDRNLTTNEIWWSDNYYNLFGYNLKQTPRDMQSWTKAMYPEDVERVLIRIHKAIDSGEKMWSDEYRYLKKDGSIVFIYDRGFILHDDSGKAYRMIGSMQNITERKEVEHELFKSKKYFESLVHSQSNFLIRTDVEGKYTFVNEQFAQKFGFDHQKLIGENILNTIWPVDHELYRQTASKCFEQPGKVVPVKLRRPKQNGEFFWTEWEFVALQNEQGELTGVQAVGVDSTDRIVTLEKLKESEERFRTLIRDIGIGVLLQGPKSEIFLNNKASLDLLGLSEDQLLGKTSFDKSWNIIHEDGSEFSGQEHPVPRAIKTKQAVRGAVMGIYRQSKKDRAWLLVDAIPRLDAHGEVSNVICTFNDITQLKEAEKSLQLSRFTIDHSSDPVFWIKPDGEFADMNPAACASLGYTRHEMLRMKIFDVDANLTHETWPRYWRELREKKSMTLSSRQTRKDGTSLDVEINANFIVFDEREFNCVFVRDVTDRKKAERALLASNHEKDLLIKEIHHRVKNNLQLISSILYIKMKTMDQSDIKSFLEETRQKIRSIALIHERLLQAQSVNEVDIADYLGKLIIDLQMSITRSDLKVKIDTQIEPEQMHLDTAIYYGLIINELVTNSIKHAFNDRAQGNIQIRVNQREGQRQLIVSNDGNPLPEGIMPGQSGSFGMQLLDIFIKQLKGQLEIDRSHGTTFRISFQAVKQYESV
jgi:PAS domain S-box-containing protein